MNVSIEGGVATLTGTVEDLRAYTAATQSARLGGAEKVINKLDMIEGPRTAAAVR